MKRLRKKKKSPSANTQQTTNAFFPAIQTKLTVGKADGAFEKEADQVADQVVHKGAEQGAIQHKASETEEIQEKPADQITAIQKMGGMEEQEPEIQKAETEEESSVQKMEEEESLQKMEEEEAVQSKEEEEPLQKMEEEESIQSMEEEEAVQAKGSDVAPKGRSMESKLKSKRGNGNKMSQQTLMQMEQGFGADFSSVNIHTDKDAIRMTQEMGAQAFTNGTDIYFNQGKYNPTSDQGKHLLAHELTHTIQQKGKAKKNIQKKIQVTGTDDKTRKKFLDKINDGASVKFKLSGDGHIELEDPKAAGTDTFSKKMIGAITAGQDVQLRLVLEDDSVFVDSFTSGKVDVTDMMGMSNTVFKSLLIHFVVERFAVKDYEKNKAGASDQDFKKAHAAGHDAQEEFLKEVYPNKTIKYKSEGYDESTRVVDKNKDGTINYVFNFTDVEYVMTQPVKNGNILENITKSELKVIK